MRFWRDVFPRFAPGIAALMLFLGLRPAFAVLLRIALGLKQALLSGGRLALGLPVLVGLSRRLTLGLPCPCGSVAVFVSVHACCLTLSAKQDGLRYAPFLFRRSRSLFVRSRGVGVVIGLGWFTSGLCVYLRRFRRGAGDAGTGLAARVLCVFCAAILAL